MALKQTFIHKGVTVHIYEQSIIVGFTSLWFNHPIKKRDIIFIKEIINTSRYVMAQEISELQEQIKEILEKS